jgi:hypothetical protein
VLAAPDDGAAPQDDGRSARHPRWSSSGATTSTVRCCVSVAMADCTERSACESSKLVASSSNTSRCCRLARNRPHAIPRVSIGEPVRDNIVSRAAAPCESPSREILQTNFFVARCRQACTLPPPASAAAPRAAAYQSSAAGPQRPPLERKDAGLQLARPPSSAPLPARLRACSSPRVVQRPCLSGCVAALVGDRHRSTETDLEQAILAFGRPRAVTSPRAARG